MKEADPEGGGRRVLHLIDTGGPGGAETVFRELVTRLPEHAWSSLAIVPSREWLSRSLQQRGVEPLIFQPKGAFDLGYVRRLRSLVREQGIDLVQTHLLRTAYHASAACIGTDVPVVSTFHGRPDIPFQGAFRLVSSPLVRRNRIVCVSESLRRYFQSEGLMRAAEVILNGIDLSDLVAAEPSALREELGLPADSVLVGAVGNVRPSKAYDVLLRAFRRVADARPEARLVIAGDTAHPLFEGLERLRMELGLEDRVRFLGFREDIPRLLASLDVFVLSSLDEGFSLATVQAMAAALPVVATRSGGPEEIVGDSDTALLVEPGNPAALAEALLRLMDHPDEARAMGSRARERALARFSVERMVESYGELYTRCLEGA